MPVALSDRFAPRKTGRKTRKTPRGIQAAIPGLADNEYAHEDFAEGQGETLNFSKARSMLGSKSGN
jgi:hypothetical protein